MNQNIALLKELEIIHPQIIDGVFAFQFISPLLTKTSEPAIQKNTSSQVFNSNALILLIATTLLTHYASKNGDFFINLNTYANKKLAIPQNTLKNLISYLQNKNHRNNKTISTLLSELEALESIEINGAGINLNEEAYSLAYSPIPPNAKVEANETEAEDAQKTENYAIIVMPTAQQWLAVLKKVPYIYYQTKNSNSNPSEASPLKNATNYWLHLIEEEKNTIEEGATNESKTQQPILYLTKNRHIELELASRIRVKIAKQKITIITGGPGSGKTTSIYEILANAIQKKILAKEKEEAENSKSLNTNSASNAANEILKNIALQQQLPTIALAAYTGKAVGRIKNSLQQQINKHSQAASNMPLVLQHIQKATNETKTLHRLTGSSINLKTTKPHSPLREIDILVIDEASMVPHEIFLQLLKCTMPQCMFVIVGDPFQLPSINSGNFLNNIAMPAILALEKLALEKLALEKNKHPAALNKQLLSAFLHKQGSYRFSSNSALGVGAKYVEDVLKKKQDPSASNFSKVIAGVKNSDNCILLNENSPIENTTSILSSKQNTGKEENTLSPAARQLLLKEFVPHFASILKEAKNEKKENPAILANKLLNRFSQQIILTATNNGENSINAVKKFLQTSLYQLGHKNALQNSFSEGKIIMVIKNNHAYNLWNGDIGIVLRSKSKQLCLYFKNENYENENSVHGNAINLNEHIIKGKEKYWQEYTTPLYSITIHKSQGDEFNRVFALFPSAKKVAEMQNPSFLNTQLLYTALTRAKKNIWLYIENSVLTSMLQNNFQKNCNLQKEIWGF